MYFNLDRWRGVALREIYYLPLPDPSFYYSLSPLNKEKCIEQPFPIFLVGLFCFFCPLSPSIYYLS